MSERTISLSAVLKRCTNCRQLHLVTTNIAYTQPCDKCGGELGEYANDAQEGETLVTIATYHEETD